MSLHLYDLKGDIENAREALGTAAETAYELSGQDITEGILGDPHLVEMSTQIQALVTLLDAISSAQWWREALSAEDADLDEQEARADANSY